jgi:hypothetical protein
MGVAVFVGSLRYHSSIGKAGVINRLTRLSGRPREQVPSGGRASVARWGTCKMGDSASSADHRPGLFDAVTRLVATIRRCLGPKLNTEPVTPSPTPELPESENWAYEIPFGALLDPAYGFRCGEAIPFLRKITASLKSVQTLLHELPQANLTRLAFEELLSETVCEMSEPVTIDGEQTNMFQPVDPPEAALDALTASIGLKDAIPKRSARRNEERDAEVVRLKKEKPQLSAGQIAALIRKNPDWATMQNGKPFSRGAAKTILYRAEKAGAFR